MKSRKKVFSVLLGHRVQIHSASELSVSRQKRGKLFFYRVNFSQGVYVKPIASKMVQEPHNPPKPLQVTLSLASAQESFNLLSAHSSIIHLKNATLLE